MKTRNVRRRQARAWVRHYGHKYPLPVSVIAALYNLGPTKDVWGY